MNPNLKHSGTQSFSVMDITDTEKDSDLSRDQIQESFELDESYTRQKLQKGSVIMHSKENDYANKSLEIDDRQNYLIPKSMMGGMGNLALKRQQ